MADYFYNQLSVYSGYTEAVVVLGRVKFGSKFGERQRGRHNLCHAAQHRKFSL